MTISPKRRKLGLHFRLLLDDTRTHAEDVVLVRSPEASLARTRLFAQRSPIKSVSEHTEETNVRFLSPRPFCTIIHRVLVETEIGGEGDAVRRDAILAHHLSATGNPFHAGPRSTLDV